MERWLFIGGPGTGKSTFINCLIGKSVFNAGIRIGSNVTTRLQEHQHNGIVYIDTPGITTSPNNRLEVSEVTRALKTRSATFKLIFVTTLQYGRVIAEDIAIMNEVLRSISIRDVQFTVVVNQVQKQQYKEIMKGREKCKAVFASICSGTFATPYIVFMPEIRKLVEEENAITSIPHNIVRFLRDQAPRQFVVPFLVQGIDMDSYSFRAAKQDLQCSVSLYSENQQAASDKLETLDKSRPDFMKIFLTVAGIALKLTFWLIMFM